MRQAWSIAWNALLRAARDPRALALMLLMPMILIGILGAALNQVFSPHPFQPFQVALVVEDQEVGGLSLGRVLADEVLGAPEVRKWLEPVPVADGETARQEVAAGRVVAAIRVPPDFTRSILSGRRSEVEVWTDPGRPQPGAVATAVVRQFVDQVTAEAVALRLGAVPAPMGAAPATAGAVPSPAGSAAAPAGAVPAPAGASPAQAGAAAAPAGAAPAPAGSALRPGSVATGPVPRVVTESPGIQPVRAMDYYAAAMTAMFLLMGGLARGSDLVRERQAGTVARVLVTPAPRWAIPAGQMLGGLVVLLAQFAILYLGTRWLYGVRWGPAPGVWLLGAAYSLAAAGVGILAATLFRDPRAADASVGLVGNLFGMLSGGMAPLYVFPDSLRAAAHLVPNYWALTGFLDLMSGLGVAAAIRPALVLVAVGVGCGALGAWRLAARPEAFRQV